MSRIVDFINYLLEVVKAVITEEAQRSCALIDRTINPNWPNWRFHYLQIIFATGAS
jgi:hypothetical protein